MVRTLTSFTTGADLTPREPTGNHIGEGRWQVYLGELPGADVVVYLTPTEALDLSMAWADLAQKLYALAGA